MQESPSYNPQELEPRWQKTWQQKNAFATRENDEGEPFYVLEMFPYPSGDLHMGHVRNYTIGDVFARFHRMRGRNVLHPMGWDALGLPAENQAILEKIAPQVRTPKNIARMKEQMQRLALAYDWSREIGTYLPDYYRWNQWFFLKFYEKGLVYRRQSQVNWCPGCNTILANEQVRDDGSCWRGHSGVTTRQVPEWAFKITAYAEELLKDLDKLGAWPERVTAQQRNWIGKSTGAKVRFQILNSKEQIEIFTTRVDTIYGCTYVVLAPEHPLALQITTAERKKEVAAFIEKQRGIDRIERTAEGGKKEGVFTGATAKNPFSGEQVPVWLANFVLADYGTGAVMSVPAHDQRDFDFAREFQLPIKQVIHAEGSADAGELAQAFTDYGILKNSAAFSGLSSEQARLKMAEHAQAQNFGEATVNWHLRDWGFSRQRYWGTPIPIIYCDSCGVVPVPEKDLPVRLPDFADIELTGQGGAPLAKLPSFYQTSCPKCGGAAKREIETMDTFVDSAWYFARFVSPQLDSAPFDAKAAQKWLPIDVYVGGPEHTVMHLLYFRFWTKAMRDLGLLTIDEPATRLITQGMVNATSYKCGTHGYIPVAQMRGKKGDELLCPTCGQKLAVAVEKMSKSKYNGIDPLELIEKYGADTARLYTLFAAPPEKDLEWNQDGVEGLSRFAARIYRLMLAQQERTAKAPLPTSMQNLSGADADVRRAVHRTLAKVSEEIGERTHFNTAIAAMMELCNTLHEYKVHEGGPLALGVIREALLVLAQMLSPFAPHLAEELWHHLGGEGLVAHSRWPATDPDALVQNTVTIAVQINGKLRGEIFAPAAATEAAVLQLAKENANVQKHLEGKTIRKHVVVPGRLVNFVVA